MPKKDSGSVQASVRRFKMERKYLGRAALFIVPLAAVVVSFLYVPQLQAAARWFEELPVVLNLPLANREVFHPEIVSNIEPTAGDTNATTSSEPNSTQDGQEAVEASKRKNSQALTQTPNDILQLQEAARQTIDKEEKLGSITDAPYVGGGTILTENNLKVQSKIPADFYSLNIADLLSRKADLVIQDKTKPTVLVYHSHTTEAYQTLDVGFYTASFQQRREDPAQNMVRVGEEIVAQLEAAGFNVIHDKNIYDTNYSEAYNLSDVSIKKYLEQYPSIDVTIDVHRDCIEYEDGTKVKPTATILDKKAAQIMIIAGCEYDKITNFPDWEYNLRFAMQLQQKAEEKYAGLMRPILFSARRYNLFETHNSILLEMGSDGNTLEEACYSGKLIGTALAEVLDGYVAK